MPNSPVGIDNLIANIASAGGLARQNRYDVLIPTANLKKNSTAIFNANKGRNEFSSEAIDWMQTFFSADVGLEGELLTAFCQRNQLPGYQFQMETARTYGPAFKIPHLPEYQDITMTFLCGGGMLERYFFDAWMYMVMDPLSNNFNYISEYAVDMNIVQYTEVLIAGTPLAGGNAAGGQVTRVNGNLTANYYTTLYDAFPISINAQELSYSLNDSIQQVEITFTYKKALPITGVPNTTGFAQRGNSVSFSSTISLKG